MNSDAIRLNDNGSVNKIISFLSVTKITLNRVNDFKNKIKKRASKKSYYLGVQPLYRRALFLS